MTQKPMLPPDPASKIMNLVDEIDSETTEFKVTPFDKLLPAPNRLTIVFGGEVETIYYTGINPETEMVTGVERGHGGTDAKEWPAGARISRLFTAADYSAITGNIEDHETRVGGLEDDVTILNEHHHDGRYPLQTEYDTRVAFEDDTFADHDIRINGVEQTLPTKSDDTHLHDERYPLRTEYNEKSASDATTFGDHETRIDTLEDEMPTKSHVSHLHDERYPLLTAYNAKSASDTVTFGDHETRIDTLEDEMPTKSPTTHLHDERYPLRTEYDEDSNDIETNLTTLDNRIVDLETEMPTKSHVSHLHDARYPLLTDYTTKSASDEAAFTDHETRIDTLEDEMPTKSPTTHLHDERYPLLTEYEEKSGTDEAQFADHEGRIDELETEMPLRSYTWHDHDTTYEPIILKKTGFNKDFGSTTGTVCEGNDARLSDTRNPKTHTHEGTDVTSTVASATTSAVCTGNAATATKLETTRTITLAGDVTGSTTFDGSGDKTITVTVKDDSHNHTIDNTDGLQSALDGKSNTAHNHSGTYEPVIDRNTAFNKDFGTTTDTVCEGNDARLSDTRNPKSHTHDGTDITSVVASATTSTVCTGNAATATKLATKRTLTLTGDATGSTTFDGSGNASFTVTVIDDSHNHVISNIDGLQDELTQKSDVSHDHDETYEPIIVKKTGFNKDFGSVAGTVCQGNDTRLTDTRVPKPHAHTSDDISITGFTTDDLIEGTTNLYHTQERVRAIVESEKGVTIATLGQDGKIPSEQIPLIAITDTFTAENETAQLALSVQQGDVCVRLDQQRSYINVTGENASIDDWAELASPEIPVHSVNGKTGAITLTSSDITEGTRLYYTEERVAANQTVAANTSARHTHTNKSILDATTASYTIAQNTKLNGIEAGATADQVAGEVPFTPYSDISATTVQGAIEELRDDAQAKIDGKEPAFTKNTAFNKNFGTAIGTVCEGNDSRLTDTRTPKSHTHTGTDITSTVANASVSASCTGNAATATKLATKRTITLTGDVGGSTTFDGSGNASITATVADDSHNHIVSNVDGLQTTLTGLQTAINGKSASTHNHSGVYEPVITKGTAFNKNFGTTTGTVCEGNDARLTDTRTPKAHTHTNDDIPGLQTTIDGKSDTGHIHGISDVTNLQTTLNGKSATSHTHNSLRALDDRDRKPSDVTGRSVEAVFTSIGGLTGTANTDYQDMLVLNTYGDSSGGKKNALVLDKTEMAVRHYQAAYDATTWGTPKILAYTDSNISGNAGTASKLETSRTITLAGDVSGSTSFDGSANKTITVTINDDSHNHVIANIDGLQEALNETVSIAHTHPITAIQNLQTELDTKSNTTHNHSGVYEPVITKGTAFNKNFGTTTGTVCQGNDARLSNTRIPKAHTHAGTDVTSVVATAISSGTCTGNAASATKLAIARTLSLTGDCSGSTTFDGTANKSIAVTVADDSHNHVISNVDGLQTALDAKSDTHTHPYEPAFTKNTAFNKNFGTASGTVCQGNDTRLTNARTPTTHTHTGSDVTSTVANATTAASCTGNAAAATKLTTARTITLTGDCSGSTTFDGTENKTIVVTVADDSHNHIIDNVYGLQAALDTAVGDIQSCFDIDVDGRLMPSETVNFDESWEADENNDLQPRI